MLGPAICWQQAVLLELQESATHSKWEGLVPSEQPPMVVRQQQRRQARQRQGRQVCSKHVAVQQQQLPAQKHAAAKAPAAARAARGSVW
jgi:hypothetical protein